MERFTFVKTNDQNFMVIDSETGSIIAQCITENDVLLVTNALNLYAVVSAAENMDPLAQTDEYIEQQAEKLAE